MLYRKITADIEKFLLSTSQKVLVVQGARQVGKTFIIRHVGKKLFKNFIELDMVQDSLQHKLFSSIRSTEDFYLQLSMLAGNELGTKEDTLVFIDEIQTYPELLSLLKFLKDDNRYTYIASGSLLGITLFKTTSIPIGSIELLTMYPLDFEEFLYANGFNDSAIEHLKQNYLNLESLDEVSHNKMMDLFKKYLLCGGLPDSVKTFIETQNIVRVRTIQKDIHTFYALDAAKYDIEHRLHIQRIFEMIPSTLENKKKRIVIKNIENKKGKTYSDYADEFDYLIHAGIALETKAISTPIFPLLTVSGKNLLKLYLNDVGILSGILFRHNIRAILDEQKSINMGTVYENLVANELKAHGHDLFYYDNRTKGEVDFVINDYENLSVLPIEVKSGKDYSVHSALTKFTKNDEYAIHKALVFSNKREITQKGKIIYLPIYFVMFL